MINSYLLISCIIWRAGSLAKAGLTARSCHPSASYHRHSAEHMHSRFPLGSSEAIYQTHCHSGKLKFLHCSALSPSYPHTNIPPQHLKNNKSFWQTFRCKWGKFALRVNSTQVPSALAEPLFLSLLPPTRWFAQAVAESPMAVRETNTKGWNNSRSWCCNPEISSESLKYSMLGETFIFRKKLVSVIVCCYICNVWPHKMVGLQDNSGWKEISGGFWSNIQLKAGEVLYSGQASQGLIKSGLGNLQGWRQHSISGPPLLLPAFPRGELASPNIHSIPFLMGSGPLSEVCTPHISPVKVLAQSLWSPSCTHNCCASHYTLSCRTATSATKWHGIWISSKLVPAEGPAQCSW